MPHLTYGFEGRAFELSVSFSLVPFAYAGQSFC